jgi:hypothetical protein
MQNPEAEVSLSTQSCILRRTTHLAKLQALLLRLLATEEQPTLPLPPLSVNGSGITATRRRNADAWASAQCEGSQADEGAEPSSNVCRSQSRAVRAFRCVMRLLDQCVTLCVD